MSHTGRFTRLAEARLSPLIGDEERLRAAFDRMPEALQDAWVLDRLEFEYHLGALQGFFMNSSRDYASEVEDALRRIGARVMADAFASAHAAVGDRAVEDEDVWDAVEAHNEVFSGSEGGANADWQERLENYLAAHAREIDAWADG